MQRRTFLPLRHIYHVSSHHKIRAVVDPRVVAAQVSEQIRLTRARWESSRKPKGPMVLGWFRHRWRKKPSAIEIDDFEQIFKTNVSSLAACRECKQTPSENQCGTASRGLSLEISCYPDYCGWNPVFGGLSPFSYINLLLVNISPYYRHLWIYIYMCVCICIYIYVYVNYITV